MTPPTILSWWRRGIQVWGGLGPEKGKCRLGISIAHCDLPIPSSLGGGTTWLEKITEHATRPLDRRGQGVEKLGDDGVVDLGNLLGKSGQQFTTKSAFTQAPGLEFGELSGELGNGREDGGFDGARGQRTRHGGVGIGNSQRIGRWNPLCPTPYIFYVL